MGAIARPCALSRVIEHSQASPDATGPSLERKAFAAHLRAFAVASEALERGTAIHRRAGTAPASAAPCTPPTYTGRLAVRAGGSAGEAVAVPAEPDSQYAMALASQA